jgi:DNA-binding CsgD family transcriptional regulator
MIPSMNAKLEINEDLLATAEQVASRRGQSLSAFVEQALRDARARSPDGLTVRELEILKLISEGLSNQAIAAQLSLSVHTVKSHVSNILRRLNADTRQRAVRYASKKGWLTQPRYGSRKRKHVDLPTFRGEGLQQGVNLDDSAALLELMEPSNAPD